MHYNIFLSLQASGTLKLSLTGHVSAVRGLAVSKRHPYLFSAGEDKMVKCWDLEQNKVDKSDFQVKRSLLKLNVDTMVK